MTETSVVHSPSEYHPVAPDPQRKRALRILKGTATFEDRFVPDHGDVAKLIDMLRSMGCVIVFTSGNWDLFHIGHAQYIAKGKEEAAKFYPDADHLVMVVGIDTDKLTKMRKGPSRPIVSEDERSRILGHLRAVDVIVPQYEPNQLYKLITHDVRVVSESTKDLPMLEEIGKHCAHVVNLPPQAETSTTARVRRLALDGSLATFEKVKAKLQTMIEEIQRELDK